MQHLLYTKIIWPASWLVVCDSPQTVALDLLHLYHGLHPLPLSLSLSLVRLVKLQSMEFLVKPIANKSHNKVYSFNA